MKNLSIPSFLYGFLFISLLLLMSCQAEDTRIRVISYNIRYASEIGDVHDWSKRKDGVLQILHDFDFAGLQEVLPVQYHDIREHLGEEYSGIYRTREEDPESGEGVPIIYNIKDWSATDSGVFWLSETPDIPGSRSWETAYIRIATWGLFRNRQKGDTLLLINLHLDNVSEEARRQSLFLVKERFDRKLVRYPVVLTGDFNLEENNVVYSFITKTLRLRDTYRLIHENSTPQENTFTGWESDTGKTRIDYIFTDDNLEVLDSRVIRTKYKGFYSSDHLPLLTLIRMKHRRE